MRTSRNTERAFTLLELLVGMSLLVMLVVVLAGIFDAVSRTWQTGHATTERLQNARAVTDMIANEMGAALLPLNRTDASSLQLVLNPTRISEEFRNPDACFWQAPVATNLALGDVAVIGYYIRWDESDPDKPRPLLCRLAVTAPDPNFLVYAQEGGSVDWLSDAILDAEAPGDKARSYKGLVAEYVVALFIQCLDAHGQPITRAYDGGEFLGTARGYDSRQGYTDAEGEQSADYTNAAGTRLPLCVLPPTVNVSFVLVDSRSAPRLGAAEKARLIALGNTIASRSPKGDASDFVAAALQDPGLRAISAGLYAHHAEITLLNAR